MNASQAERDPAPAKKSFFRENAPLLCGMALTAIGVTAAGLIFHQSFFRILPLYVSLTVALLQSRMIRTASLIGGINSILYAVVYAGYHLYGSAVYALLFSCPVQLVTFILWRRKPWGKSTVFKKMTARQRIVTAAAFAAAYAALQVVLHFTGGEYALLDGAITLLGVLTAFLTMLAYMEYAALMVAGNVLSIALYIAMLPAHPEQTTYLIFTVYSLACCLAACFRLVRLYAEQQRAKDIPGAGSGEDRS